MMKIQNVNTKYINFITPGVAGGKIKVILLTGRLGYFSQNKKILNTTKHMMCDIQKSAVRTP